MSKDLTSKTCVPCKGGVPPLTLEQAESFRRETPKWELIDEATRILRSFAFPNFVAALDFVNQVGDLAERENHHPDITFGWGYADVCLQTHKIKGLHENDFILAAKIDRLAGSR